MNTRGISTLSATLTLVGVAVGGHYELKPTDPVNLPRNSFGGTVAWLSGVESGSGPYVSSASGYGNSAYATEYVGCDGIITTVYVWVRDKIPGTQTDDPLDNPPEEVISAEYCRAWYDSWGYFGGP